MIFGSMSAFAITCEIVDGPWGPDVIWGHLGIWVRGQSLGYDNLELLSFAAAHFENTLDIAGLPVPEFADKSDGEIMDLVYHPVLGFSQRFSHLLIGAGEAFDGCFVLLTPESALRPQHLIWRFSGEAEIDSEPLTTTEYRSCVRAFLDWYYEERRRRGPPVSNDPGSGRPRLIQDPWRETGIGGT